MSKRAQAAMARREDRRAARERLAAVRAELREARVRRKRALFDAREQCRAERIATRERVRAEQRERLAALREAGRAARAEARATCSKRLAQARAIRDDGARARERVRAEKALQGDLRRASRDEEHACARQTGPRETDDDVRANLPSNRAPLFDRVRRLIKAAPRTESFLR